MNVAIIGCGLIGNKRGDHLGHHELIVCADTDGRKATVLAKKHKGAAATDDWEIAATHPDVDIVIVATTPNYMPTITLKAIEANKHVLVEKPAARNALELRPVVDAARKHQRKVRVGFNHRYHPALQKAHEIMRSGRLGPLMFIRGRYGHGGRPGYEKEWRANPDIGGGGELLDQGMHLIDLSRWFLGDFTNIQGHVANFFWSMPVEDNAFMMLRTEDGKTAWLQTSWTEWKNLFSFEIFGRDGKLQIDGLGGSYGLEKLTHYQMLPQLGPPAIETFEFPGPDVSWQSEFNAFVEDIEKDRETCLSVVDAYEALKIVGTIYETNRESS